MPFELIHFRGAEKILKQKNMEDVVKVTCEYINDVLYGSLHRGGLLRQALDECDWRPNVDELRIVNGRRYCYKGFRKGIAIDGNFASYEAIWDSLLRLQVGWVKKKIDAGIVLVTAQRSEKTPYGSTRELIEKELELLSPTISVPVTVALFELGKPGAYLEAEATPPAKKVLPQVSETEQETQQGQESQKSHEPETSPYETDRIRNRMIDHLNKLREPPMDKPEKPKRRRKLRESSPPANL